MPVSFALIDTTFGACGVAWRGGAVRHFQLPEGSADQTAARLLRRAGAEAVPGDVSTLGDLADRVRRYFTGERVSFADVRLDFGDAGDFHRAVYYETLKLGWGETTTYGAIARKVSEIGAARAVGQAMGANPIPLLMPCHRVLASGDRLGGFSAFGGAVSKEKMLALEGVVPGMPLFAWTGEGEGRDG